MDDKSSNNKQPGAVTPVQKNPDSTLEDRIVREAECLRLSGLSRTTRWRLEQKGQFPRRRKLSDNAVGWLLSEVQEWRGSRPCLIGNR